MKDVSISHKGTGHIASCNSRRGSSWDRHHPGQPTGSITSAAHSALADQVKMDIKTDIKVHTFRLRDIVVFASVWSH